MANKLLKFVKTIASQFFGTKPELPELQNQEHVCVSKKFCLIFDLNEVRERAIFSPITLSFWGADDAFLLHNELSVNL